MLKGNAMEARNYKAMRADRQPVIVVGGNEDWFHTGSADIFGAEGLYDVAFASSKAALSKQIESSRPDLIVLHDGMNIFWNGILEFMSILRRREYRGIIIVVTDDPSADDLMNALCSGVDDYLYLGPKLDLRAEVERLLSEHRHTLRNPWNPEAIDELGFFRSVGLNEQEINLLVEYARDFPRRRELAVRIGKSEIYLRKCFSQIYTKLKSLIAVDNQAQLAHLLTICCLRSRIS